MSENQILSLPLLEYLVAVMEAVVRVEEASEAAPGGGRKSVLTSLAVIQEIEKDAQRLATSVDELIDDMAGTLQSVSPLITFF